MHVDDSAESPGGDPLGPETRWSNQTAMIIYLVVTGLVLTLATWRDLAWAYIVGLLLTAIWILGFVVVRDRTERWFRW
jgi:lysylphosphatidylglycerol synthetase-like protein (DUF2156 family)